MCLNFNNFAKCLFEYLLLGVKVINIRIWSLSLILMVGFYMFYSGILSDFLK